MRKELQDRIELEAECIYDDGQITTKGQHKFDKNGYCIFCGKKNNNNMKSQREIILDFLKHPNGADLIKNSNNPEEAVDKYLKDIEATIPIRKKECIYNDGEITTKGDHKFDKDGFCIICGEKQDDIFVPTREQEINVMIGEKGVDANKISDGYHTFGELYEHRIVLFIALCKSIQQENDVWKSTQHSDGSKIDGWFILGINKENGRQITYHLPEKYWGECKFARIVHDAPEWDGHTSEDVLKRISLL